MAFVRRSALAVLLVGILAVAGCSSGKRCDTCSSDSDCEAGLACQTFSGGGSSRRLCGNPSQQFETCSVPR